MVRPWLRWPTTARLGSGAWRTSSATDSASSTRAARVVDLGGHGALDPRVHVEDRVHLGMLAVDHPVLDRVDRHPPRLDARGHAQLHDVARVVVAR